MPHGYGHHFGHWHHWMRPRFWAPWRFGGWGFYRRPCCLFFALPILLLPFLVLLFLAFRALRIL